MDKTANQFVFDRHVSMKDVGGTLRLAQLAAESLHGQDRVALEAACRFDCDRRCVQITTTTDVGRTLAAIFRGYARREFGPDAMRIDLGTLQASEKLKGVPS